MLARPAGVASRNELLRDSSAIVTFAFWNRLMNALPARMNTHRSHPKTRGRMQEVLLERKATDQIR